LPDDRKDKKGKLILNTLYIAIKKKDTNGTLVEPSEEDQFKVAVSPETYRIWAISSEINLMLSTLLSPVRYEEVTLNHNDKEHARHAGKMEY
jgi:hypothetical protein